MKMTVMLALILLPLSAAAQNYPPGMDMGGQDMQAMMLQAQKAQACMEQVDQDALQALEEEGRRFEAEIKALCAAGKRDQAQKKAMAYGRKMAASPVIKEIKKCAEMMQGMVQNMFPGMEMGMMDGEDGTESAGHVCDSQ